MPGYSRLLVGFPTPSSHPALEDHIRAPLNWAFSTLTIPHLLTCATAITKNGLTRLAAPPPLDLSKVKSDKKITDEEVLKLLDQPLGKPTSDKKKNRKKKPKKKAAVAEGGKEEEKEEEEEEDDEE